MGVYIKGMEIRENCMSCAARHGAECWLADCSYIPNYRKERPKWCPIVPVPPHGRLGDLDMLDFNNCKHFIADGVPYVDLNDIAVIIRDAPTIIPEEKADCHTSDTVTGSQ